MRAAHRMAAGLLLVADSVKSASFYNSSCDTAYFRLDRDPTVAEKATLVSLGWEVNGRELGFSQSTDWLAP